MNEKRKNTKEVENEKRVKDRRSRIRRHKDNPKLYKAKEMYYSSKKRAKKNGWDFDLDIDFIFSICVDECKILGHKLNYCGEKNKYSCSLDRIDSSKGYTKDNVQVISFLANLMKSNANNEELIKFASYIIKNKK